MKRVALLFSSLLAVIMAPLVSAFYFGSVEYAARDLIETARELFTPFLEVLVGEYYSGEFFFAKVLLLVLLFIMVQYGLKKVPSLGEQKSVVNIVAAVVSILAVRFLRENELINGILLPYGTLGILITSLIPAVIFFYILHKGEFGAIGRRLGWVFFGIVFAVLWVNRWDEMSPVGNQIYGWMLFAVLIFVVFDKNIHYYFGVNEDWKRRREMFDAQIADIDRKLAGYYAVADPTEEIKSVIKNLEKRRKNLKKNR